MQPEKERLLKLLKENKISEAEFNLLLNAINKKQPKLLQVASFLVNPFQKIAGMQALIWGIVIIAALSFFGVLADIYFSGIFSILNAAVIKSPKLQINFFLLLYQNVICWVSLSAIFLLCTHLLRQKGTRVIDFFGTVAFARIPYLILAVYISIMQLFKPDFMHFDISKGLPIHPDLSMLVFGFIVMSCGLWQIATYFYAFKESSGLQGKKLIVSFIISTMLAELITSSLTMIFL